ncbi:MAG: biosynthetic arginine decarboxylase, partial [Spirochaetota bacterium]
MKKNGAIERWTYRDSAELYGIRNWGSGYFDISEQGEVVVNSPGSSRQVSVSLMDIISGLKERGLNMPVLLRFSNILDSRIAMLNAAFQKTMQEYGYKGLYRGVYPIKVNQQQQVVEEVCRFGKRYHHGLEAGSKAELIAALAYMHDPEAFVVCNGYKDEEFVDLALYALKMGIQAIMVVERPGELSLILERSLKMGVKPRIGVRVKISSRAGGLWSESGGDRSVFGLTTPQIIDMVDLLKRQNMLDCFQMLHYHLGSQIPNIRDIRAAASEACRFYVDLVKEGAGMGILDIGGGLAVDYDGSQTNFPSSRNYTTEEFCADIIETIMGIMDEENINHPVIISESGRATVAYYSILLFNILDVNRVESHSPPEELPSDSHEMLVNLMEISQSLTSKNALECYHDAVYYRDEIRSLFMHGDVSLREKGLAERIFWHIINRIARDVQEMKYIPEELQVLDTALSDIYYGNFSVFQSLPDSWAIEQLFPIMPIHRLNEEPMRRAILADTTCDCDGKIDRFIDLHDVKHTLPLHDPDSDEDYILGVFLVGAYQETLGDLHNLLGDTNVVSIRFDEDGEVEFSKEIAGDSVSDVLSYVEYDLKEMVDRVRRLAEQAVRTKGITPQERRDIMEAYENG